MAKKPHSEKEIIVAAQGAAHFIMSLVDGVCETMKTAAAAGVSPNELREVARDAMIEKGMGPIQAANIVRLALHKLSVQAGLEPLYCESHLREICRRVSCFGDVGAVIEAGK